jgi:hypothetical protein
MMIAAGGNKRRRRSQLLHQLKSEHAAIELKRPIEIGDLQMHVADAHPGMDRYGDRLTLSGFCFYGHRACSKQSPR